MCIACKIFGLDEADQHEESKHPWVDDPVGKALPSWESQRDRMDEWMMENGLGAFMIDELALQFRTTEDAANYALLATRCDGVKVFNTAIDSVDTQPFRTHYDVGYIFLETPATFRLEVMAIKRGCSPLHEATLSHLEDGQGPIGVHLSFKVDSPEEYANVCDHLLDNCEDAIHVQSCESTYGSFSYWQVQDFPLYLKPRVNKRDQEMEDPPTDGTAYVTPPVENIRGDFGMPGLGSQVSGYSEMKEENDD